MIKEFEKEVGHANKQPYIECFVNNNHFKAIIDTGADITVIPHRVIPGDVSLKKIVKIRGHSGIITSEWTKDIEINIPELGIFRPENGVITTEESFGLIGTDIINLCELQMVGGVFMLTLLEEGKWEKYLTI